MAQVAYTPHRCHRIERGTRKFRSLVAARRAEFYGLRRRRQRHAVDVHGIRSAPVKSSTRALRMECVDVASEAVSRVADAVMGVQIYLSHI